jgi:pyruvate formate lyase activating enzyme
MINWRVMNAIAAAARRVSDTGLVFNLQRCSIHDGPGIRTTVFFKGCPLRCTWCHNPEGIDRRPQMMVSTDRCISCHACSEVCPIEERGAVPARVSWDRELCIGCGSCVDACPADARELAGREYEVGELVDLLERDRVFFDASGGGVTFSGGEPLAQPEFLAACLRECRRRGLHTVVDTCGLAARETVLETARLADLVLYDLKHMDPDRHLEETGADNHAILENLRALSQSDTEVWIRIPLIPGFNDDMAAIEAMGAFLEALPRRHRVFVLPYHGIAEGKRSRLGVTGDRVGRRPPDADTITAAAEEFARHDLRVSVGGSS